MSDNTNTPPVRNRRRAVDVQSPEGRITVSRARYGMEPEDVLSQAIPVQVFKTDPARVRVSGSATKNLGDFNSVRVEVMVELPCYPESSEIQRAYDAASGLVDQWVERELFIAQGGDPNEQG